MEIEQHLKKIDRLAEFDGGGSMVMLGTELKEAIDNYRRSFQ